jgi:hypothetical protein
MSIGNWSISSQFIELQLLPFSADLACSAERSMTTL